MVDIGDNLKDRLKQHKLKGNESYHSVIWRILEFYEKEHNMNTDLRKVLTTEELNKYRNLYHDFECGLHVSSPRETPPSMQHTLNWERIHKESDDYFTYKNELEKKYNIKLGGFI